MISGWPNYPEFRFPDNDASQFWSCWKLDFVIVDMYSSQPQIQPRTQACSRYPSDLRRLGTERDSARHPGRIFPKSLTGDVTSEIAEDDWERGCLRSSFKSTSTLRNRACRYASLVNANFSVNQMCPIICRWKLVKHRYCFGDNRRTKDNRKIKLCGLKACCVT